jgi:voltage-gated sodium channel
MIARCREIAESRRFLRTVLGLIVFNAILMGLETSPGLTATWGPLMGALERILQAAFVVEIVIRVAGRGPAFFRDGWNLFDFVVVAVSLVPAVGPFATVARLARVLRVARVVSGLPELRLIIGTMLRSIPSLAHVVVLLSLLLYIYGVLGYHLFGKADPDHWGSLARAVQTLFIIITLEGWVDILEAAGPATMGVWIFYASFIVVAVFVVINLFIAVVINNLETTREEDAARAEGDLGSRIREIRRQLDGMERALLHGQDAGRRGRERVGVE